MGAADLRIKVGLDSADFSRGLDRVKSELSGLSSSLSTITGVGAGLFGGAIIKQAIDFASQIDDLSKKTGVGREALQRYSYAAQQSGTSVEAFSRAILRLNRATAGLARDTGFTEIGADGIAAAVGAGKLADALRVLNIEQAKFVAMPADQQLLAIGQAMADAGFSALSVDAAFTLLGKGAGELIPVFKEGGEALRKMLADAPVMADETIKRLDTIGDRLARLGTGSIKAAGGALVWLQDRAVNVAEALELTGLEMAKIGRREAAIFTGQGTEAEVVARFAAEEDARLGAMLAGFNEARKARGMPLLFTEAAPLPQKPKEDNGLLPNDPQAVAKSADAVKSAQERIAKLQRDGALAALDANEKIVALEKESESILAESRRTIDGLQVLELTEKRLAIENQIADLKRRTAEQEARDAERLAEEQLRARVSIAKIDYDRERENFRQWLADEDEKEATKKRLERTDRVRADERTFTVGGGISLGATDSMRVGIQGFDARLGGVDPRELLNLGMPVSFNGNLQTTRPEDIQYRGDLVRADQEALFAKNGGGGKPLDGIGTRALTVQESIAKTAHDQLVALRQIATNVLKINTGAFAQ